jgi:hypothetical protein
MIIIFPKYALTILFGLIAVVNEQLLLEYPPRSIAVINRVFKFWFMKWLEVCEYVAELRILSWGLDPEI